MGRAQSDSEFVETAFTIEEVVEVNPSENLGDDARACAFLETARQPPANSGPSQSS